MSKEVKVSTIAIETYVAAQGAEIRAVAAYTLDTNGFEGKQYDEYNKLCAENARLSLGTMRNRASVARKIQSKYGVTLAGYAMTEDGIKSVVAFIAVHLSGGGFVMSLEDMTNWLNDKKPEAIQLQEKKEKAEAIRAERARIAAEEAAKLEAEKAKKQADMSGTPDSAPNDAPQQEGADVGKGEQAESTPVESPAPAGEPVKGEVSIPLLVVRMDEQGMVHIDIQPEMAVDTLEDVITSLQAEVIRLKLEEKAAAKKAKKLKQAA